MAATNSMSFSFTDSEMPVRFGRYMLLRRLTTDAIGEHFLSLWGVDEGYDQLRVVRAIYPAVARDADFVALFSEEARSLSQLLSSNVARVVEVGVEGDIPFVAQDHVEGLTLNRLMELAEQKGIPSTWELAVHVVSEILRGLDYVHRREDVRGVPLGMRHGDVRPKNVLVSYGGEVKLTNFNSALYYVLNEATNARFKTERGIYAPPEVEDRNSGPSVADDLWGASAILLSLVAGPRSLQALQRQNDSDMLPSIAYSVDGIPKRLNLFLARALHPEPDSRFENAFQMRDNLLEIIRNSAVGHPPDDLAAWAHALGDEQREEEELFVRSMLQQEAHITLDNTAEVGKMGPGHIIDNKYHLLRLLGEGGMGQVFEAEHLGIEKRVAVKVLHERVLADRVAVERFKREAKIMGGLHHPNVVEVYDYGETADGNHFLVMALLDGVTLASRIINHGPVPPKMLVSVMIPVCDALETAHQADVIHRDLKPENIFLTTEGPRLVDFGIAKRSDLEEAGHALTQTGNICGTVEYISPEQLRGHEVDCRLDVYAAGLIMYEALTGHTPFRGRNIAGTMQRVLTDKVVPPRKRTGNYNIPVKVERVCLKAMARAPEKRYQSARELKEALEELDMDHITSPDHPSLVPKKQLMRNLTVGLTTAIITLILGAGAIWFLAQRDDEAASVRLSSRASLIEAPIVPPATTERADNGERSDPPGGVKSNGAATSSAVGRPDGSESHSPEKAPVDPEETRLLEDNLMSTADRANQQSDFDKAYTMYKRAVELDPSRSKAWYGLGKAAFENGDEKRAVSALRRALKLNPGRYRWRIYLGKIYMSAGEREKAIREWQRVQRASGGRRDAEKLLDAAGVSDG